MKQYFKYFTLDELNQEIQNRFSGAKSKIDKINQIGEQSVDRKFYDYVSEIKSKQKQYQCTINQPTELNYLLKKRRNKINQSIEKYERNLKCKTFSDFQFHPQFSEDRSFTIKKTQKMMDRALENKHHSPSYINYHSLLEKGKAVTFTPNQTNPKSKTQSNFFNKDVSKQLSTTEQKKKEKEEGRLRSITKVVNITVNNGVDHRDKLFSFAKNNSNEKVLKQADAHKKAIRFQTTPAEIRQCLDQNSERLESVTCRTLDQICIKKIKQRIKSNYVSCKAGSQTKIKVRDLELIYEEESLQRIQLKQQILTSAYLIRKMGRQQSNM